jgi:C-22 sterol desaturase
MHRTDTRPQVPYKATKAFPISETYTVPAGSMLIPSFFNSLHDPAVYPEPESFLPERWLDPTSLANSNPKSYMVWGAGPHRCIGLEYAMMNIALVLGIAATMFDWEHEVTPLTEKVECVFLSRSD